MLPLIEPKHSVSADFPFDLKQLPLSHMLPSLSSLCARPEHREYFDDFRVVHLITRFTMTAHRVHAPQQAHPIILQSRAHGLAAISDAHVSAWFSRSRRRCFTHHQRGFLTALSAIDYPLQGHFPPIPMLHLAL